MTLQPNPAAANVHCKLCSGTDFHLRHEWPVGNYWNQSSIPLAVWDCATCSLVMLYPVPTPEQLPGQGDWFSRKKKDLSRKYWWKRFRRRVIDAVAGTKSDRFLRGCLQLKKSGRLLDIGCGDGAFLEKASAHYQCAGVEPSEIGAAECRKKGFEVYEGFIEKVSLPENRYDMITMDSVIEHVLDPVEVLKICFKTLKPGGFVGMITPKIGGPAYQLHGAGWHGFRHGWHTFLFTGKTLTGCLRAAGFETVARPQRDRPFDDGLMIWGKKPGKAGIDR